MALVSVEVATFSTHRHPSPRSCILSGTHMVIVSRWMMSEMNTSDAPSRQQEQHQPQDQVMQPTDEQGQSETCLARTWECDASSEEVQGSCTMSGSHSGSPTVSHRADGHSRKVSAGDRRALSETYLGTKEASGGITDASLCVRRRHTTGGRQRRHNRERDRSGSSTPRHFEGQSRAAATAADKPYVERSGNQMSLPQHGTVEPRTLPNCAASLVKFVKWVEHRERGVETVAEIDAAMSTWMKSEFKKGSRESSGERLVSAWVNKPFTRKTRFPRGAVHLGKPPGLAAPRTWTLEEALATNSMFWNRVPAAMLPGASASWGPAEVSRMEKTVVVLHVSDLFPVLSQGDDGVPQVAPYQGRHSGASNSIAGSSGSMEPMAPHVSEESVVCKALERRRALKGPLLVECGQSFLSWPGIAKMRNRPGVNVYKFPCSHRQQYGATVICSSRVDPVELHGAQFWCSCDSQEVSRETACHALETSGSFFGIKFNGTFLRQEND